MRCGDCGTTLTDENFYPYTDKIEDGRKHFFCKECVRKDMMMTKEEFKKEIEWCAKSGKGYVLSEITEDKKPSKSVITYTSKVLRGDKFVAQIGRPHQSDLDYVTSKRLVSFESGTFVFICKKENLTKAKNLLKDIEDNPDNQLNHLLQGCLFGYKENNILDFVNKIRYVDGRPTNTYKIEDIQKYNHLINDYFKNNQSFL